MGGGLGFCVCGVVFFFLRLRDNSTEVCMIILIPVINNLAI